MMRNLFLCFTAFLTFSAIAEVIPLEKFAGEWEKGGYSKAFTVQSGKFLYDSTKAQDAGKFRWARLTYPSVTQPPFTARIEYTIGYLHHFNGFELELASKQKGDFSAVFRREAVGGGKHRLAATVNIKGRPQLKKEIPYGAFTGALILRREKNSLTLSAENSKAEKLVVLTVPDFPEGAASFAVKFTSAAHTHAKVELRKVDIDAPAKLSSALYPNFSAAPCVTDAVFFPGDIHPDADGTCRIRPGQSLLCALPPMGTVRRPQLIFQADGPVKATVYLAGSPESAVTGEILLKDHTAVPGMQDRKLDLGGYCQRYAFFRKWDYPLLTYGMPLLIEWEPAGNAPVRIGKVRLSVSAMRMADAIHGAAFPAHFDARGVLHENRSGEKITLSGRTLPFKTGEMIADAFPALALKLTPDKPAFTIPAGRKIGLLELLHAAGKQQPGNSAVPAACQFVYADGSTFTGFLTLRWNTGCYAEDFAPRGNADHTWWGPTCFPCARLVMLPYAQYGAVWYGLYRSYFVNPMPQKTVRSVMFYRMPGSGEFLFAGVRLLQGKDAVLSAVEPDHALLKPGEKLRSRALFFSPDASSLPVGKLPLAISRAGHTVPVGTLDCRKQGNFACGKTEITVPVNSVYPPGPAVLTAGQGSSAPLGVMPEHYGAFHYSMITGPFFPAPDFERMRRIGYDTVKLVVPWHEAPEGKVTFTKSETYLKNIADAGLQFSIRNHIRLQKGPEYFAKKAVFQFRYEPGKAPVMRPQIDPADPWTVSRIVNLYRETARFAQKNHAVSINANYGLRPETGLRHIDMGRASLGMFRKELAKSMTLEALQKKTGLRFSSFDAVEPLDLLKDKSGFLLKTYLVMHHRNLEAAQRAVVKAIREEGYTGHLTFNVSYHPVEQKLIGANTGAYLRLSREFPPASLFHETSDRYSLSFVKWLAAKRTLGLPYGDEGCACPPSELSNRIAYLWMGMMQTFDALTCQWFGGKPGMFSIAAQKSLHALLYDAEYLPDPFCLALALDSGFDEAPETVRGVLHGRTLSHYGLAGTLRELNLNADRYWIDEFPELDGMAKNRLLIDDNTRSVRPAFGARLENFIRGGGTFLCSKETDCVNGYAFLKKMGIDPARCQPGQVVTRACGKGKLVYRHASWATGSWDPGLPEKQRAELLRLFCRAGEFRPLVQSSVPQLFVTPYRAKNGDLLLQVINISGRENRGTISFRSSLGGTGIYDHATGRRPAASVKNGITSFELAVAPFNGTVVTVRQNTRKSN